MAECIWEKTEKGNYKCLECGKITEIPNLGRRCRPPRGKDIAIRKNPGLGDKIAIGIDKTGINTIIGKVGCSGCGKRQEKLNELGDKITGIFKPNGPNI